MQSRVWIFQYKKDVKEKGADGASHYVGWYDMDGKRHAESCGPGARGRNCAEKRKRQLQSELDLGVHRPAGKTKWSEFRNEYEQGILPNLAPQSRVQVTAALDHFERIAHPGRMDQINTQMIDAFVAARRNEQGKRKGANLAPATVNKDLRHVKAALRVALDWGLLPTMPKIRMVREPQKLVSYVTPEHFAKIYREACPLAELPNASNQGYEPSEWWRAMLATAYMTGWRIGELLALRVEDVDLGTGTVTTRHADNKGKRDERVPVHSVVLEHLRRIIGDRKYVFPWPHDKRTLWVEFGRIQKAAGISLPCREEHEHTPACHVYGFHDFRRAFATVNATRMKPETLQKMMRHQSYKTTLGYINLAQQVEDAVKGIWVPDVLHSPNQVREKEEQSDGPPGTDASQ